MMMGKMIDKYSTNEDITPADKVYDPVAVATALSVICGIIQVRDTSQMMSAPKRGEVRIMLTCTDKREMYKEPCNNLKFLLFDHYLEIYFII